MDASSESGKDFSRWPLGVWLLIALAVVFFDQASKWWAFFSLAGRSVEVTPFFNLVLAFNTGAAFSFLAGAGGWQRWFFVVLALVVSGWIYLTLKRSPCSDRLRWSLVLIMGGALGNVVDRLVIGAVIDFLDFHWAGYHWPAFNLADSAICLGAALMVWDGWRPQVALKNCNTS